jgi:hypothetical protein
MSFQFQTDTHMRLQSPVRTKARISVNKLGEYMVASPRRRRSIIVDQKRPKTFQTARYADAQDAIAAFIRRGAEDYSRLQRALDHLRNQVPTSQWDSDRIDCCVEAIERFMDFESFDFLSGFQAVLGHSDPPKLAVSGVEISVRPEIILRGKDKKGGAIVGSVKLYIGKTIPLRPDSAAYVTTTLHQYVDRFFENQGKVNHRHCYVLDVFAGEVHTAPKSFQARRGDIAAACEEIARAWADESL